MSDALVLTKRNKLREFNSKQLNAVIPKKQRKTACNCNTYKGADIDKAIRFEPQSYSNIGVPINDVEKADSDYKIAKNNEYQARIRNIRIERDVVANMVNNVFNNVADNNAAGDMVHRAVANVLERDNPIENAGLIPLPNKPKTHKKTKEKEIKELSKKIVLEKVLDTIAKGKTEELKEESKEESKEEDFFTKNTKIIDMIENEKEKLNKKEYMTLNHNYIEPLIDESNLSTEVKEYLKKPTRGLTFEEMVKIVNQKPESRGKAIRMVSEIKKAR